MNSYENLWKAIIRPPREKYTYKDLGLNFKYRPLRVFYKLTKSCKIRF